jgi:hypothetical protein
LNTQQRRLALQIVALLLWLGACYGVRYLLMEDSRWVERCYAAPADAWCAVRSSLGLIIHFQVLAIAALALAVPAFVLRGPRGRQLAWAALVIAAPALALYTVTAAVFALLLALLRLVRAPRHSASVNTAQTSAHPSA